MNLSLQMKEANGGTLRMWTMYLAHSRVLAKSTKIGVPILYLIQAVLKGTPFFLGPAFYFCILSIVAASD